MSLSYPTPHGNFSSILSSASREWLVSAGSSGTPIGRAFSSISINSLAAGLRPFGDFLSGLISGTMIFSLIDFSTDLNHRYKGRINRDLTLFMYFSDTFYFHGCLQRPQSAWCREQSGKRRVHSHYFFNVFWKSMNILHKRSILSSNFESVSFLINLRLCKKIKIFAFSKVDRRAMFRNWESSLFELEPLPPQCYCSCSYQHPPLHNCSANR